MISLISFSLYLSFFVILHYRPYYFIDKSIAKKLKNGVPSQEKLAYLSSNFSYSIFSGIEIEKVFNRQRKLIYNPFTWTNYYAKPFLNKDLENDIRAIFSNKSNCFILTTERSKQRLLNKNPDAYNFVFNKSKIKKIYTDSPYSHKFIFLTAINLFI